jgi:hypothetical protein
MRFWHIIIASGVAASLLTIAFLAHGISGAGGQPFTTLLWASFLSDRAAVAIVWVSGYGFCAIVLTAFALGLEFRQVKWDIERLTAHAGVAVIDATPILLRLQSWGPVHRLFRGRSVSRLAPSARIASPEQLRSLCARLYFERIVTTQGITALLVLLIFIVLSVRADPTRFASLPEFIARSFAVAGFGAIVLIALLARLALSPVIAALARSMADLAIEMLRQILASPHASAARQQTPANVEKEQLAELVNGAQRPVLTAIAALAAAAQRLHNAALEDIKASIADQFRLAPVDTSTVTPWSNDLAAELRDAIARLNAVVARLADYSAVPPNNPAVPGIILAQARDTLERSSELRQVLEDLDGKTGAD